MRAEAARADRARAMREAARSWREAGAVDDAARAAVDEAHPDDRVRLGPALRLLVFGFTVLATGALMGIFALFGSVNDKGFRAILLFFGALSCVASDVLRGPFRRSQGGVESAAGAMGATFLSVGVAWLIIDAWKPGGAREVAVVMATVAVLFAAAAVRWGSSWSAVVATVAVFALFSQLESGRRLWMLAGLVAGPLLVRLAESPRLPPSHRRSCLLAGALALVALYGAVNLRSLDAGWVESFAWHRGMAPRAGTIRAMAALATALVPLGFLVAGFVARSRLLLDLGLLCGIASLVTLRFYVHVAPLWLVLIAAGTAAVAVGLAVRRWLHATPGRERAGFTAEPLFGGGPSRAVELAGVVGSLAPDAQPAPPDDGFTGGGGRMGGAGASGSY